MGDISFVSTLSDIGDRPSIPSAEGALGVRPKFPLQLDSDAVKEALANSIGEMSQYLDHVANQHEGQSFELDEVELAFQVSQSGKVTVFVADVSGQMQGGIKLVWKRKPKT